MNMRIRLFKMAIFTLIISCLCSLTVLAQQTTNSINIDQDPYYTEQGTYVPEDARPGNYIVGNNIVDVIVDGSTYKVNVKGAVLDSRGNPVSDENLVKKAKYTANVARERIYDSEYNKAMFAPVTRTMIELQSLVKPVAGPYAYVLFSSGEMSSSLVEGGLAGGPAGAFGNVAKDIGKDAILEVTKQMVEHPEKTAMKMANDAYAVGLRAYQDNYRLYHDVSKDGKILSYDEAVDYMANEKQKEMLKVAPKMIRDIRNKNYKVGRYEDDSEASKQMQKKLLTKISDMKSEQIGKKVELAYFMTQFKPIFDEALAGLEEYEPYSEFQEGVVSLNDGFEKLEKSYYDNTIHTRYKKNGNVIDKWQTDHILPPAEEPNYVNINIQDDPDVSSKYVATTKKSGEHILREYKSVPGGVTLEGKGLGIDGFKSVKFEAVVNAFIINGNSAYVLPVTRTEMRDILISISKSDKMGVSLAGDYIVYGALPKENDITLSIRLLDKLLGHIAFGSQHEEEFGDYNLAKGYEPKKNQGPRLSGMCVYFRFGDYKFKKNSTRYELESSHLEITLIPTKKDARADDGGALPDFDAIQKGSVPSAWKENCQHISSNIEYYMKERMMRMVNCYGEAAAFARALKRNGIDLKELATSM